MSLLTILRKNLILSFLVLTACQQNTHQQDANASSPASGVRSSPEANGMLASQKANPLKADELLFSWVDHLNIRDAASSTGKTVARVQSREALAFTGETSSNRETIVLRGVAYEEPWLKVITPDKTEGWVFGGAVKRKDEIKGNTLITEEKFDFPFFGYYDLSTWHKQGTQDDSGGDAEMFTATYKKGDQLLEITKTDVGEYRYSRRYKLMDSGGKLLKERTFVFEADADPKALTETVKDYTSNPPKQYQRSQTIQKHFMRLNALPIMVNGAWVEQILTE